MDALLNVGIVLAGGRGSRMESKDKNKTSLDFNGQPILCYGLDLFQHSLEQTIVVKGAFGDSVQAVVDAYNQKQTGQKKPILTTTQRHRLGTGHAAVVANRFLIKEGLQPKYVFVGYGDHLMFYHQETVAQMQRMAKKEKATIVMIAADVPNPFGLGRVVMDENGHVLKIVEQKNATPEEQKITLINAGLYCFDYDFFSQNLKKLQKNPVSKEYYLTDLIEMAVNQDKKVLAYPIPYQEVGIGINTKEEMVASARLHADLQKK